jgi:hypothetical protein
VKAMNDNNYKNATEIIEEASSKYGEHFNLLYKRAELWRSKGQLEKALK